MFDAKIASIPVAPDVDIVLIDGRLLNGRQHHRHKPETNIHALFCERCNMKKLVLIG